MGEIGFATLVSAAPGGLLVSHIPLLVESGAGPYGTLIGHFARPNPHWQEGAGQAVVAIFLGSNGYITPNWYETKRATGKVVPTWNYIAVHAHGSLRTFHDPQRLHSVVSALTERHEERSQQAWHVADAPAEYIASMLAGIVGIEIPIERIEGKFKLSQNRPSADISGAIEGLGELGDDASLALARAMAEARPATTR